MSMKGDLVRTVLLFAAGVCVFGASPGASVFDARRTVYGFFPSPTRLTIQSVFATYSNIRAHGDVVLHQPNIPWKDFLRSPDARSHTLIDLSNQMILTRMHGLEAIFVVDPLNGLNRREFKGLPFGWKASFSNRDIRASFTNFTMRILKEFKPRYLGLASEINTYADTYPDDVPAYVSLYKETYALVKSISPGTKVFVTFQWEDLNNIAEGMKESGKPYDTKWEIIEAFEPMLDVWTISTYPFIAFKSANEIPKDYYAPLLTRTKKPLAVAEGGFGSVPMGNFGGSTDDQIAYIRAVKEQLSPRLKFWIYLIVNDLSMDDYKGPAGRGSPVLSFFSRMGFFDVNGKPKPSLAAWDEIRTGH